MQNQTRWYVRALGATAAVGAMMFGASPAPAQVQPVAAGDNPASFVVDGRTALHALVALSDAHLQKAADVLTLLATTDAARSADWERIRSGLGDAARMNVPALYWFALPDGSYWTLEQGRATANLSDRAYFPRLLAGQPVVGDLVVSRATGKSAAIVAVPVLGDRGEVVGALGSSVYLDSLSLRIQNDMGLAANHLFYSLNAEPLVGLHMDPATIFLNPMEEGDQEFQAAIRELLSHESGMIRYRFRDQGRTVLYRKSPLTGWWYAFGVLD
jgi:hypothetical protein